MKRAASIRNLFEGRGHGGPTVTVHIPEKLAHELFAAFEEALGMSGEPDMDDMGDLDGGDDDMDMPFDLDGSDDDGRDDGGEGDDDFVTGDEDDDEPDDLEDGYMEAGGMMRYTPNDQELEDNLVVHVGGGGDDAMGMDMDHENDDEMDEKHMGFKKLAGMLSHQSGVNNPSALAAAIGRKKHGPGKMAKMAAAGRRKH